MEKSYIKISGCMFRYGISKCKIVVCNKTPVVRNGKQSTLGYQPEIWKKWE